MPGKQHFGKSNVGVKQENQSTDKDTEKDTDKDKDKDKGVRETFTLL